MGLSDYIISILGLFIVQISAYIFYCQLSDKKLKEKLSISNILIIIFFTGVALINFINNLTILRCIVIIVIWLLQNMLIFKEEIKYTFLKTLLCYSIYLSIEFAFSILVFSLPINNLLELLGQKLVVLVFTIFIVLFEVIIIIIFKKFKNFNEIIKDDKKINILYLLILFILLLQYKNVLEFSNKKYILNMALYCVIFITFVIALIQQRRLSAFNIKNNVFLEFLKTYERQAEVDSEFKHEIFNNLLIIKSIKNKEEREIIIDNMINKYDKNVLNKFKNISALPTGIKGIIYYKMFELENMKVNVELNISPKINGFFNKKNIIEYKDISEILTILMDNAIEAVKKAKKKLIIINLYLDNGELVFEISNSFASNISIKPINKIGYSTKGKNRGIGLYIANKIINENSNFSMYQKIEKKIFYTKLIIKL